MSRGGDRLLSWGFAAALTLHVAALAGAACLPMEAPRTGFGDIRVFDEAAPALATPVELVEWPSELSVGMEPGVAVRPAADPQLPPQQPPPRPANRPEPRPPEEPAPQEPAPQEPPAPVLVSPPDPVEVTPEPEPSPVEPRPLVPPVSDGTRPGGGGGGGGGFVDLGTPSPAGDLTGAASGETPIGEVPGVGSGSGTGVGPGSEGGTGGGSGGGAGTGDGTGIGEGSGSGSGGGTGDGGSPGFVSRTADRKEPVVVFKGSLEYPPAAAADGAEGTVRLEVAVTELGVVSDVKVVESSHDRRLDDAAVEFVRGWRYKPAIQDGQPRRVWTHAVVKFELQ